MAILYDANVWVALGFENHPHFKSASRHFELRDSAAPANFCRSTQQAFLRLLTTPALQRAYGSPGISNADAWGKCEELLALPQIGWLNEPANIAERWQPMACLKSASPKVWMDAYLAAFAIGHDVELVTFDRDFRSFEKDGLKLRLLAG